MNLNFDKIIDDVRDRFTTWETILGGLFILAACFIYLFPQFLVNLAIPGLLLFIGFKWLLTNKYRGQAKADEKVNTYRRQ